MKAAILIPVLTGKDAVGADAMAMARVLEAKGIDTRVFCEAAENAPMPTWPADELLDFAGGANDLVIHHLAISWPKAREILKRCKGFRVVKYHNVTPAEFFKDYSSQHQAACESGRAELPAMVKLGCELYLGDSTYNIDELRALGVPRDRSGVLAPFHRVEEMVEAEADLELLRALSDGARNFLMVGRLAPNKAYLDLIDAFSACARMLDEPARLILVGKVDARLSRYNEAVHERIRALRLEQHVCWINAASEAQLKAAYLASHAFLLLSQHEGFCVPLIESMALSVPVIARATTAIPETLGDAGILWQEADPWLYAASASRIFSDQALRADLQERGRRRYAENFSTQVLSRRFMEFLEPAL